MESEARLTMVLSYLLLCTANTLENLSHGTFNVLWPLSALLGANE